MTYVATFALAFGGLLLEIAFTRLASLLYFSPFVYVLLSVAVLGAGLGAAVAAAWPRSRTLRAAATSAALASLTGLLVAIATTLLATGPWRAFAMALLALPFAFVGHALATLFARRSNDAPRLYLADLLGAGLGALAVVPLANLAGPYGAIAAAALALALAGSALTPLAGGRREADPPGTRAASSRPIVMLALVAAVAAALVAIGSGRDGALGLRIADLHAPKPLTLALRAGAEPLAHRWDALGRTDLVRRPGDGVHVLYLDGGAGSVVPEAARPEIVASDVAAFPFAALTPTSTFVIGPGAGLDVALARAFDVDTIVAVELNRAAVTLTNDLATLTGDVYGAGVELLVDDGRTALAREHRRFDLILLSHVVTDAAEARNYALAENGLYTVEAFRTMLERLAPGGAIAFKLYDELTLTRALLTAVRALATNGVDEATAARHVMAVLDARGLSSGQDPVPLLLVFDRPLERERAVALARAAEARQLGLLYVPGLLVGPPLEALLAGDTDVAAIADAAAEVDIAPVTDARPYFFDFEPGLPRALRPLVWALLALSAMTVVVLAVRPPPRAALPAHAGPVLAATLGVGFMTLEIAALHHTRLVLGHPTMALAVTLSALLVGAGLGSGVVGTRVAAGVRPALRAASLAALASAAGMTAWWLAFPLLADAIVTSTVFLRSLAVALSLAVPAALMGIAFPLALRALGRDAVHDSEPTDRTGGASAPRPADTVVAVTWAVNGIASVVGAVTATVVASTWGAPAVAALGVAAYLAAATVLHALRRSALAP
ncbi:MAG: hypothetical protein R6W77_00245 [Trueperaceae bacterium]